MGLLDGLAALSTGQVVLLLAALAIAFGFEVINGFHDTANAVATVIYTKSLRPTAAVVWSGIWNFIGVHAGGIGVAFSIVHLLPVDLLVNIKTGRGLAMVLSLLGAAILWNFATWYRGLPASSSHSLIGSIMGVGMANAWMERGGVILSKPTSCKVSVYDQTGNQVDTIESATPQDSGVFWLTWSAGGLTPGSVYFAKVEMLYSGFTYSSGLTFTLVVPLSDEISGALAQVAASTNVFLDTARQLTNISLLADDLRALKDLASTGFTNLTDLGRFTTNLLRDVKSDTALLTNQILSVVGPKLDALTNAITTLGGTARRMARGRIGSSSRRRLSPGSVSSWRRSSSSSRCWRTPSSQLRSLSWSCGSGRVWPARRAPVSRLVRQRSRAWRAGSTGLVRVWRP